MRSLWVLPLLVVLTLSGCGVSSYELHRDEESRYQATQPFLNGNNGSTIVFFCVAGATIVLVALILAFAYVRASRHAARIRIAESRRDG